jgi:hypothetical protein
MVKNGCAFGQVTREKVESTHNYILEIKSQLNEMDDKITDLFNHQSNRVPPWVAILLTLGASLISGLAIWTLTH